MLKKSVNDTPKPEIKANQNGGTKPEEVKPGDSNTLKKHENQTKVTLKPPTLLYIGKPQLTSTQLSGREEDQNQTIKTTLETNQDQNKQKQEITVTTPNQKRLPKIAKPSHASEKTSEDSEAARKTKTKTSDNQ